MHQGSNAPAMSLTAQQQLRAAGLTPEQINKALMAMRGAGQPPAVNRPPPNSPLRNSPLQMPQMAQNTPPAANMVPPGGGGQTSEMDGILQRVLSGTGAPQQGSMGAPAAATPTGAPGFQAALAAPPPAGPSGGALPPPTMPNIPPPGQGGGPDGNSGWAQNLMQFGLATMAAGDRPGASLLGSLGQGGLAAMQSAQQQQRYADHQARQKRRDRREDERLEIARQNATPERFEPVMDAQGKVVAQRNTKTGKFVSDPRAGTPKERRIVKGADGFNYYSDNQERVLPGVEASPGRSDLTALQKDVPFIAKLAGISMKEALALKLESKDKSYDAYVRDLAARYASASYGADRAFEQATAIADLAYGRAKPPEVEPDSEEGSSFLRDLFGFGGGESAASGGREAKAATKKGSQENPHTPETQADFDAIKSGEIYTDPDDQKIYRKP